jgi:LacI family transcriptional regulator
MSGVSQTTVSRVLRGHPHVRQATREKVLRVLAETGYAPSAAARTMRTGSTGIIGVLVGRVTNSFYPELAEALNATISEAGQQMSLWLAEEGTGREAGERAALAALRTGSLDGIVFTTATAESAALSEALVQHAPIVLLNRTLPGVRCDTVASDNVAGGRTVARYFIAHARSEVGLIGGPLNVSTGAERERGFVTGLAEHDIALGPATIARGEFTYEAGRTGMEQLLGHDSPPRAVFCVNDVIAFGALDAAREAGVRVPDELWVVGFDDTAMASWGAFALTTVRQPVREMAQTGIRLLLERIDGHFELAPRHERLAAELVVRRSTGGAAPS